MESNFENNVKNWVDLDNEISKINAHLKELKDQRSEINSVLQSHVESNNLENLVVKLGDGRIKFTKTKQTTPITLGFLKNCLEELVDDIDQVNQIMDHIKSKREIKFSSQIKRYYDD